MFGFFILFLQQGELPLAGRQSAYAFRYQPFLVPRKLAMLLLLHFDLSSYDSGLPC